MGMWPNNRRDILGHQPVGFFAASNTMDIQRNAQDAIAYFGNTVISQQSSVPEGAFQGRACILAPIVGGGMASADNLIDVTLTVTGNVLSGGMIDGNAAFSITEGSVSLSMITSMDGSTTVTFTGNASVLSLTIGLDGTATWELTGSAALAMLVPAEGTATITISGTADLRGLLALAGESTPYTELSPESLAAAVWNATAASYVTVGTMGEKMNDAGSASNPWTEVIESGYTAAEILRMIAAVSFGQSTIVDNGGGSATVTFKGIDEATDRIIADMLNSERLTITKDGT